MGAKPSHSLGLSLDAAAASFVEALGLDKGEGYFPVKQRIVGQEDPLLATLAQELLDLVAAIGEGGGLGWSSKRACRQCWGWGLTCCRRC
jgi:hypothetical protein